MGFEAHDEVVGVVGHMSLVFGDRAMLTALIKVIGNALVTILIVADYDHSIPRVGGQRGSSTSVRRRTRVTIPLTVG